jgi:flagellar hook-basal body complex protein FliE
MTDFSLDGIPTLRVTPSGVSPSAAAGAYAQTDSGTAAAAADAGDFSAVLQRAAQGVVQAGHDADAQSMQAISGNGDITQVVTAVSQAELALQTTVAIRDRVVQAYQDIMKMPI